MSWLKHTGCTYHTQDTGYYCGAAVAMMVLAEIGVPYSQLDQDDLYTSNHDHNVNSGWYTDPYGLRYTLVNRRPSSFSQTFVVHKPTTEAEGTRDIVYTLHRYGVTPGVLVFGCMHWIAVPGIQTDVEPTTGSYTVEGFWINNPVYHAPVPPPPHDAADGCGSGGILGVANQFVTYTGWQNNYFTGCAYDDPAGSLQYISVCDPDPRNIELPLHVAKPYLADGQRILVADQVFEFTRIGLREYGLHEHEEIGRIIRDTRATEPQLVLRLDRPNSYYYLVPLEIEEGVMATVQVDARFGVFESIAWQAEPIRDRLLSGDARAKVYDRIAFQRFDFPEQRARVRFFPEAVSLSPTLVWRPCWESFSPHLPFYHYSVGGFTTYVRIDGEVFTQLTTTGCGV